MIQDLHCHTYYSHDSKNRPEELIDAAIQGGITQLGICDHNYSVGFSRRDARRTPEEYIPYTYTHAALEKYFDHISLLKEKYADRITLLRGIEVCTTTQIVRGPLPDDADISFFDYCLVEHLDHPDSVAKGDLFSLAKRCGCPYTGVAHTDLFAFIENIGEKPFAYFSRMAKENIFWELNVNFDSIHHFREHRYVAEFFENKEQQDIIRASGVCLSVGFDCHNTDDYLPERIATACNHIRELGIPLIFEEEAL